MNSDSSNSSGSEETHTMKSEINTLAWNSILVQQKILSFLSKQKCAASDALDVHKRINIKGKLVFFNRNIRETLCKAYFICDSRLIIL
jgi:hypothetical protein